MYTVTDFLLFYLALINGKKCSRKYQDSQIEQIVIYYCDNELRQN
jgi:hypothetical protein